jgi:hypothetical protein
LSSLRYTRFLAKIINPYRLLILTLLTNWCQATVSQY